MDDAAEEFFRFTPAAGLRLKWSHENGPLGRRTKAKERNSGMNTRTLWSRIHQADRRQAVSTRSLCLLMVCCAGCLSNKPDSYIGSYALTAVNGQRLPFTLTNDRPDTVVSGTVTISTNGTCHLETHFRHRTPEYDNRMGGGILNYVYVNSTNVPKLIVKWMDYELITAYVSNHGNSLTATNMDEPQFVVVYSKTKP